MSIRWCAAAPAGAGKVAGKVGLEVVGLALHRSSDLVAVPLPTRHAGAEQISAPAHLTVVSTCRPRSALLVNRTALVHRHWLLGFAEGGASGASMLRQDTKNLAALRRFLLTGLLLARVAAVAAGACSRPRNKDREVVVLWLVLPRCLAVIVAASQSIGGGGKCIGLSPLPFSRLFRSKQWGFLPSNSRKNAFYPQMVV